MKNRPLSNEDIVDQVNSMSLDELEHSRSAYERTQIAHEQYRTPLYVIVAAAVLIGIINSLYIGSGVVFIMCLLFGGGTFVYLWLTWHGQPKNEKR